MLLTRVFSPVRYYAKLVTFLVGAASASAWGVASSLVMACLGRREDIQWLVARFFLHTTAPLLGVRFRVEGADKLETTHPAVLVGNHQTMLDLLYLGAIFPQRTTIMAKRELQWVPILGQFMTLAKAIFVNRVKREDAIRVFDQVAKEMKRRSLSLFIFPEGTRSASPVPSLLPFKKGAFHLAVQAGLPIVPIVCENYAHVYHSKARRFDAGEVVIRVLDPIPTTGVTSSHDDITALIDRTRGAMLAAIEQLGRERRAKMGEREALLPPRSGADAQEGEGEGETASARLDAPAPVHK
ncbi:1-acyl-sn-gylcerol-3-phosphate acyltransferase [Rhodotorula diobovata]|uniref:1-acyl-sn-glycerol-3-phosphate acyltransferase n=1 Tax=Rhodotorula diobovata TaxID=5288 RepID=A0A5C5FQX1_9BASI|nr:1-acyl-sn-gylcerol-3-phosphate acyltransferase [Rhodotorula diobovata]